MKPLSIVCDIEALKSLSSQSNSFYSTSYLQTTSSQKPSFIAIKTFFSRNHTVLRSLPHNRNSDANSTLDFPCRAWLTTHDQRRRRTDCRVVISGQREVVLKFKTRPKYASVC